MKNNCNWCWSAQ